MEQVQNVELLQEGTECIALRECVAESNESVSPTYLKTASDALTDQDTKLAPNINKKIKSTQEVSSESTFSKIPTRKIIIARRKLESKRVATPVDSAVVSASPNDTDKFKFEAKSSTDESISNCMNSSDDKVSFENSSKLGTVASTEGKTSNSPVYNSADDSDNESDEELKRLIAKSRSYRATKSQNITIKEFRQITGANIDVISYIVSKIDDVDERRSFEDPINLLRTSLEQLIEYHLKEKKKKRDDLKAQIDICRANIDESIAELEVEKKRLDSIEAGLLSLDEDNNLTIPQTSSSMTARAQHSLDIQSNQRTSSIKEKKTEKLGKEKDQQLVETELQKDFQNFKISQPAVTTSEQRCWCDAGQLKLQLDIERAIVKRWVSKTPLKEEIDLEAGHKPSKSCESTVPRISRTNDWWTEELEDLRVAYTRSRRRRQQNVENQSELLQAYRNARTDYTRAIKLAKQRVLDQSST